jgi:hypothetical protein
VDIQIRNVKFSQLASRETLYFDATVYVDGAKAGTAASDGNGGTFFHPRELQTKLDTYAATLPKEGGLTQTGETIINGLVADWLIERDTKRAMNTRILYTVRGEKGVFQTKPLTAGRKEAWLKQPDLATKLKADKILNLLPLADAVMLMKTEGKEEDQ